MELSTLSRTLLFDTYGEMLTEKQRLCFDLRYNQDLSLGEIAELEGISRHAVRDNIVRTEGAASGYGAKNRCGRPHASAGGR